MPDEAAILENVRKLFSLGLSEGRVFEELKKMGISETQAKEWMAMAQEKNEKQVSENDNTLSSETSEKSRAQQSNHSSTTFEKNTTTANSESPRTTYREESTPTSTVEKLWEKGILATVDNRLNQMEKIKREIDTTIEGKTTAHYAVLEKKIETLFESQRELMKFKTDAMLESKIKDMDDIMTQKIEEIRHLNTATQEDLQRIKGQRMIITDLVDDFSKKTTMLEQTRRTILDDTHQKLEELEEKINTIVSDTEKKVTGIEDKATQTLELEQKITEGLAQQVETQANQIIDEKVKDLRESLQNEVLSLKSMEADAITGNKKAKEEWNSSMTLQEKKMNEIMEGIEKSRREQEGVIASIREKIDTIEMQKQKGTVEEKDVLEKKIAEQQTILAGIQKKIDEMTAQQLTGSTREKERIQEILKGEEAPVSKIKGEIDAVLNEQKTILNGMISQKTKELDEKIASLATISSQTSGGKQSKNSPITNEKEMQGKMIELETKLQTFDAFEKQFIENIKKSTIEREELVKQLKEKAAEVEKRSNEKIQLVESRLKQLDTVIGQLSQLLVQFKTAQTQHEATNTPAEQSTPAPQPPEKKGPLGFFKRK